VRKQGKTKTDDIIKMMGNLLFKAPKPKRRVQMTLSYSVSPDFFSLFGQFLVLISFWQLWSRAVLPFKHSRDLAGVNLMVAAVLGIVEGVLMVAASSLKKK